MAGGGGDAASALSVRNVPRDPGPTGPMGDESRSRSSVLDGRKRSWATRAVDLIDGPEILRHMFWAIALLALADTVVFVLWWDKRYPVAQRILAGQAFEGFQRFVPGDNRTQTVLAEIRGGPVGKSPKQRNCSTPSCLWLREYLDTTYRRPEPCHDFYGHVCSHRTASVYETVAEELMTRVAESLRGRSSQGNRAGEEEVLEVPPHVRAYRDCTSDSDYAEEYTVICDFSALEALPPSSCDVRYPKLPLAVAEGFFQENPLATVEQFAEHVYRLVPQLRRGRSTWRSHPRCPAAMGGEQAEPFCRRLGQAASCHLKHGINKWHEDVRLYKRLWNELYFVPFVGKLADRIVSVAHGSLSVNGRDMACLSILEDFFPAGTMHASEQVLSEGARNTRAVAARLLDAAQLALASRVSSWMSRVKQGDRPEARLLLKDKYRAELEAIAPVVGTVGGRGAESMFSWKAYYDKAEKNLVIPYGLLALTSQATTPRPQEDPIIAPLLMASTMRPLLPKPNGAYVWFESDSAHMTSVVNCFTGAHNITVDLARNVALESALLTPLFDLYRSALSARVGDGVRLHPRLENGKIVYVLWAAGHCGRQTASDVVNTAVKNSARFSRTFGCTVLDPLWSNRRCNFWAYW